MKPFTYQGHKFYLSSTTTTVRQRGREVNRWIIACDGPYGWRAGFNDRPTTIAQAKEHLRSKIRAKRHAAAVAVAEAQEHLRYLMGVGEYAS